MPIPSLDTVPHFYHGYIQQVRASDAYEATHDHLVPLINLVEDLTEEEWSYRYAPGKWTIKELAQHVIDAERIFCHRALSIARGDSHPLPGFDEEAYASASSANKRTGASLLRELKALGASTQCLFSSFEDAQLQAKGVANGLPVSVNAIAFIIAGHALHHSQIVQKRYLDKSYQPEELVA
jgi:uncharacterized damage-inducible protein DinB